MIRKYSCNSLGLGHGSRVMRVTVQLTDGPRGSRVTKCNPLSALIRLNNADFIERLDFFPYHFALDDHVIACPIITVFYQLAYRTVYSRMLSLCPLVVTSRVLCYKDVIFNYHTFNPTSSPREKDIKGSEKFSQTFRPSLF